jgi:hypothetical protein
MKTNWPTKEGWYWFKGKRWSDDKISIHAVKVWKGMNGFVFVCDGNL